MKEVANSTQILPTHETNSNVGSLPRRLFLRRFALFLTGSVSPTGSSRLELTSARDGTASTGSSGSLTPSHTGVRLESTIYNSKQAPLPS